MMPEHTNRSDADLGSEAVEEMAKYGITCAQISQFFYRVTATRTRRMQLLKRSVIHAQVDRAVPKHGCGLI